MREVRTVVIKDGRGYKVQHKQQAQLPFPISRTCLFFNNPFKAEQNSMLSLSSCRFASFKEQILEGTTLKQTQGEFIHTKHTHKLHDCGFHTSFSCTETKHNKKTAGQDPTRCEGCPWHDPSSECLRTSIKWENPSAVKSSRAAGDFLSCQGDTASKPSVAAQQDETNTAGTWERLIQGVILAGRQAKIWRHCVYGVKKISSSFCWSINCNGCQGGLPILLCQCQHML